MLRFWEITKRQRDKERRLQQSDPAKQTIFYESPDGEQSYIVPSEPEPAPEPEPPDDPEEPSDYVRIVKKSFIDEAVWSFAHGLGSTPAVTIWKGGISVYGYGTQPYGTSPYGGGIVESSMQLATHEPAVTEVDSNTISIDWGANETGKVVAIA